MRDWHKNGTLYHPFRFVNNGYCCPCTGHDKFQAGVDSPLMVAAAGGTKVALFRYRCGEGKVMAAMTFFSQIGALKMLSLTWSTFQSNKNKKRNTVFV